jgi:hypothetical protein
MQYNFTGNPERGALMDKEGITSDLKKIAKETEVKLTGFLLRWKERREGNDAPDMEAIEKKSRIIAGKANEILERRGKKVFNDIKDVYVKKTSGEDNKD